MRGRCPNSNSFALHWDEGRFGVACAVYARSSSGWQPVPWPDDLPMRARAKAEAMEGFIRVDSIPVDDYCSWEALAEGSFQQASACQQVDGGTSLAEGKVQGQHGLSDA